MAKREWERRVLVACWVDGDVWTYNECIGSDKSDDTKIGGTKLDKVGDR